MCILRMSLLRTALFRPRHYSDHSIDIYSYPDLHRDKHIPRPVHRDIRFSDLHGPRPWYRQLLVTRSTNLYGQLPHFPECSLYFYLFIDYALVGVIVGRNKCRHLCYGRGSCISRRTCIRIITVRGMPVRRIHVVPFLLSLSL